MSVEINRVQRTQPIFPPDIDNIHKLAIRVRGKFSKLAEKISANGYQRFFPTGEDCLSYM